MTQTQELIERLEKLIVDEVLDGDMRSTVRAAAARLSQLEGEVGRLREALRETIIDLNVYANIGIIRARTIERRAALREQEQRKP